MKTFKMVILYNQPSNNNFVCFFFTLEYGMCSGGHQKALLGPDLARGPPVEYHWYTTSKNCLKHTQNKVVQITFPSPTRVARVLIGNLGFA